MRDHSEMDLMLKGYGLTTAKILYHYPDHPHLLQSFVWQDYDLAPKFPVLIKFIEFWKAKLDGPLHSVVYTHQKLIAPNEWRKVDGEFVPALRHVDIKVRPACEWRLPARPVLTYCKYAPLRFAEATILDSA